MSRFIVLDHFIVTELMLVNSVKQMLVIHHVCNLADREPIVLDLEFNLDRCAHGARSFTRKPGWHKSGDNDIKRYYLSENLL